MLKTMIALAVIVLSPAVSAAEIRMSCENPRGPYLVVYDSDAKTLTIDPDMRAAEYRVDHATLLFAEGPVGYESGLAFRAYFGPNPRIRFYSGQDLVQTDLCEPTVLDLMGN